MVKPPENAVQVSAAPFASAPTIAVCADPASETELLRAATRLAVDLNLPILEKLPRKGFDLLLVAAPGRLELRVLGGPDPEIRGGKAVSGDLLSIDISSAAGRSLKQPLAKALGIKKRSDPAPVVIDATAGWGEDAWVMAALNCRVLCIERNKVIATLLRDSVLRAGIEHMDLLQRLTVVSSDGKHLLRRLSRLDVEGVEDIPSEMKPFLQPDVVYLDPMFPGHARRKTAERKPMKVLRMLAGDDDDASELYDWAMKVARKRVIVKRPMQAPSLSAPGMPPAKPDIVFEGKGYRFDVHVTHK